MLKTNIKKLLENQLYYVIGKSHFYREKLKGRKISVSKFFEIELTTKDEIIKDQIENPPFGKNLAVHKDKILRIHKTSGTTSVPLIVALTKEDIKNTIKIGAMGFKSCGLKREDMVIHCLNYNMWAGGYTDHQSLECTGAAVIPYGVGNSVNLIEMILLLKPTAIHCTPSYLAKLEEIIKNNFNLRPIDLKLRLGLFGGESGLQNCNFRNYIETTWGFKAMNANYGVSEVLSMFGSECSFQAGLHFMGEGVIFPEIIDISSKKSLPIERGVTGELVLTNLCKEAQPLIRYRTGDIVKIIDNDCLCKNNGFRFEIMGRRDDMFIVKGVNVFINCIEEIIAEYLNSVTAVYYVLLKKEDPIDKFVLKVELRKEKTGEKEEIKEKIINDIKNKIGVKPDVEFVQEGVLGRTEGKSKKIIRCL